MAMHRGSACTLALLFVACGPAEDGRESGSATSITGLTSIGNPTGGGSAGSSDDDGVGTTMGSAGSAGSSSPDGTAGDGPKFDIGNDETSTLPPSVECETTLVATVRDFAESHPDFEYVIDVDPGIVQSLLGGDGKPVYAGGTAGTTTGQASFDQWYRDVAGVNINLPTEIALVDQGNGTYVYDNPAFFPIDGQGFGDEGNPHNYHFTLEMHTQFTYQGGEVFTFRGDDDLFTFVNGHLGIDLGGVHGPIEGSIDLDAMAGSLGIVPGGTYDLDFFFAERHTSESNFRIETTIGCFHPPG
jgi:fibro-slime domain-containing protein